MSSLTPKQQEEYQKYQQIAQQLAQVQQNYTQMQLMQREMNRTIETLEGIAGDTEIFQRVGQILVPKQAGEVLDSLKEEAELLEVRVTKSKKQVDQYEQMIKESEKRFREVLGQ